MDTPVVISPSGGRVEDSVHCLLSVIDGPCFKGVASNLSVSGLYIEVSGDIAPPRDSEVEVFLEGSENIPAMHLRGTVARSADDGDGAAEGHLGLGIRIHEAPADYHALFGQEPEPQKNRRTHVPYPLLAYNGNTLDDIFELLSELGAQPRRVSATGPDRLQGWEDVPKILIVDAADALNLEVPGIADRQGVLRVAIASSQSEILANLLRRLGYQYLIRRPLHRDAIEILLRNLLHKGESRRASPRVVLGIDASIQTSLRGWQRPCSLLDLSRGGCLLAASRGPALRKKVQLVVGSEYTGAEELSITGHVIRRRFDDASGKWQVALRFHPPADVQGARIGQLLQRKTVGPNRSDEVTPHQSWVDRARSWLGLNEKGAALPSHPDRRRTPRARMDRHVCKLDASGTRVTALLTGYDLSAQGMRVQAHPELELGNQFTVSLHDEARKRPLEVPAEVIRDDGADGLALRFTDLDGELQSRLDALISALPHADSLVMAGIESNIESVGTH
ncbi:MAG: PilZ domain-containing protein [Myxococcota bacterium]|nr:PilZ domain-containing protein [Myxococcota bacterium]